MISKHLEEIQTVLGPLSQRCENILLIGDYNIEPTEFLMFDFSQVYRMTNLIKSNACYNVMHLN